MAFSNGKYISARLFFHNVRKEPIVRWRKHQGFAAVQTDMSLRSSNMSNILVAGIIYLYFGLQYKSMRLYYHVSLKLLKQSDAQLRRLTWFFPYCAFGISLPRWIFSN